MKKTIFITLLLSVLLAGTNAFALPFNPADTYFDLNTVAKADTTAPDNYFTADGGDGVTGAFSEFQYLSRTLSKIDTTGAVIDRGMLLVTNLELTSGNTPGDNELEGSSWGMTIVWDDLKGQVISTDADGSMHSIYTEGTFSVYIDYHPFALNDNDIFDFSTFTDGFHVATIDITSGSNTLAPEGQTGSSYDVYGDFSYLLDDFWFEDSTKTALEDFVGFDLGWIMAYSHGDTNPNDMTRWTDVDGNLFVLSDHDSSLSVGVVPEPSTFLLLGGGLMGLGFYARRRKK